VTPDGRAERIATLAYDYDAQPKQGWEPCNLCGADAWVIVTHVDRYGYDASTTACRRCGGTMLNPRMTREAYGAFYESHYRPLVSAYHGRLIDSQTIKGEQADYAGKVQLLLEPYVTDASTLLDIGGSTGVVASHLAQCFGLHATVLDPAPDELVEAKRQGLEVITGFVEDWEPGDRRFDVVGMFQTLDHLLDIGLTLNTVRQVLAPGGVFVADIVDFRAAYLRNWSVSAATKIDHPFSLTQLTIETYLRRAGLDVVRTSFSADRLHVLYICRATEPEPDALPDPSAVERYLEELRYVQNAPLRT
jgi:ubiquinone/menaquinone biosynthesis C-methylase UbiE